MAARLWVKVTCDPNWKWSSNALVAHQPLKSWDMVTCRGAAWARSGLKGEQGLSQLLVHMRLSW